MSNYTANALINDPNHSWSKILSMIPAGSTVLDVGCSSGNLGRELMAQKQCIVDGIELDPGDATIAAKSLRHVWVFNIEDAEAVKQLNKKYDVIIFADVLEHLVDPASTLKRVKGLLKPNGSIVFSIPNMAHVSIRLALLRGEFRHTETGIVDKTHLHFYDLDEVKRVFHEAGMHFSRLDQSPYPYPASLIRTLLSKVGLTATPKTLAILAEPSATAFQFVGAASFGPPAKDPVIPPAIQPLHNDMHELEDKLQKANNELKEYVVQVKIRDAHIAELKRQIREHFNSKMHKLARTAAAPYRGVRGALRRK